MSNIIDLFFIFGAKYLYLAVIAIFVIWFLAQPKFRQKEILIVVCVCLALAIIFFQIAGQLYYHSRPFVAGNFQPLIQHKVDNSFPSHHMLLVSFLAAVVFLFDWGYSLILWGLALLVGASRVYVGVHYLIDIAGSLLIAIIAAALGYFLVKRLKNRKLLIFKEK